MHLYNDRFQIPSWMRGSFFLAILFLRLLTGESQAQPFPGLVQTNINLPSGTTPNTFGYVGQTTTISGTGSGSSTLSGYTVTSTGNGSDTPLFIYSPANEMASGAVTSPTAYSVSVTGLTVTNGLSHGGNSNYGGGGAGLGGGVFVGAGATLTLNNVNVTGNSAVGGSTGINGGGNPPNGGGGIGGNPVNNNGGGLFVNGADGGAGGFGGGGASNNSGGFGGGGGYGNNGSNGGFGGGGSGRMTGSGSSGGVGGGHGSYYTYAYGGGGAGFGGGIFVQNSAAVIVTGNSTISGNTVTGGSGSDGGVNGSAAGADIFMMGGSTVTLAPGAGNTVTIGAAADNASGVSDVADDSADVPGGSGAGAGLIIGNSSTPGGTVILYGNNTYAGGTTLQNGVTLVAGNSTALGTGLTQVNGGTLVINNSAHLLTVGNYAQNSGTLFLHVAGSGQNATADLVHVTNTVGNPAVLGGILAVNLNGFTASALRLGSTTTYTFNVVDTDAGYTGTFGSLDALNLGYGLTASLDYAGDDVLLQIVQGSYIFALAGLTPNQQSILGPVNNGLAAGNGSPNFTALIAALVPFSSNPTTFSGALDELSPQEFGQFTSETAFNNASFETEAQDNYAASRRAGANGTFLGGNGQVDVSGLTMNDPSYDPGLAMVHSRLLAWNPGPVNGTISDVAGPVLGGVDMKDTKEMTSVAPAYSDPWNFYVRGNVILAQGFSQNDVAHFDDNTESVVLGTDYRISPNFLIGLTAGYGHTDVTLDNNGSSATVDSYSPGLYASYADKGWYANVSGNYTHNAYTQSRVIGFLGQTADSAPEGNQGTANLDGGYDFHQGALTYGPLAGVQYTHLSVDGYTEGGSAADLSVNGQDSDSLRSRLGGRLSYAFSRYGMNFTPHLDASWQHEFLDQSRGITSQFTGTGLGSFSVRTTNPSRDSALADVGLDADVNRTLTLFSDYEVQAGQENYFGQSVQGGVRIGF